MKILITTGLYPPDIGGPATYSKLLADELPKHGFDVEVLSFSEVRKFPVGIRHVIYFFKVLSRGRKVDIIYAQDPVSVGFPSAFASVFLKVKFVLKIVGDYAWEQYQRRAKFVDLEEFQNKEYDFNTEIRRKLEIWTAKEADKIIVPSQYLKKIVTMWGVNENKINVVYNSFSAKEINITKEEARKKLNLSGTVLISAGRLVSWKGFKELVELMPEIIKEIPDAKLYIIGSGPENRKIKRKITKFKIRRNVFLLGQLTREELLEYKKAGDIFVLNTGYEGLSHHLLEAMAMEIPIITTDIGGNPEIIKNNENGILVGYNAIEKIKTKIIDLQKSELLKEILIKNAKEKVKEFDKEKMINEIVKILL